MDLASFDQNNVGNGVQSFTTAHATGVIVIGAVVALWAIRRGFRGVNFGGVGVHV